MSSVLVVDEVHISSQSTDILVKYYSNNSTPFKFYWTLCRHICFVSFETAMAAGKMHGHSFALFLTLFTVFT